MSLSLKFQSLLLCYDIFWRGGDLTSAPINNKITLYTTKSKVPHALCTSVPKYQSILMGSAGTLFLVDGFQIIDTSKSRITLQGRNSVFELHGSKIALLLAVRSPIS